MIFKNFIEKVINGFKNFSQMGISSNPEQKKKFLKLFIIYTIVFAILTIASYFIGKYILIPLVPFVILFMLQHLDKVYSSVPTVQTSYPEVNVLAESLCKILSEYAEVLDIVRPANITDIVPIKYPVCQTVDNLPFYRFIVMQKPDSTVSLEKIEDCLYQFIAQYLSGSLCPNLPRRYYKDIPYFAVFNVAEDFYHRGYLFIDIMPVSTDVCYNFILSKRYADICKTKNGIQASPSDEDF